ncbi:hypothetical protein [Microbacterium sp. P02]|uniref:hypothetical protein n=1 Tax=Microbacterium sp. P02 TaxID=3366260 RepID=UPI00366A75D2
MTLSKFVNATSIPSLLTVSVGATGASSGSGPVGAVVVPDVGSLVWAGSALLEGSPLPPGDADADVNVGVEADDEGLVLTATAITMATNATTATAPAMIHQRRRAVVDALSSDAAGSFSSLMMPPWRDTAPGLRAGVRAYPLAPGCAL